MKKYVAILLALFAASTAHAESERLYVEPGCIYVAANGIFVNIEGELCGVTSLEVDDNGVYIPAPVAGYCGYHGEYPGSSVFCPYCLAQKKRKK